MNKGLEGQIHTSIVTAKGIMTGAIFNVSSLYYLMFDIKDRRRITKFDSRMDRNEDNLPFCYMYND
jgi:hypothetical protein